VKNQKTLKIFLFGLLIALMTTSFPNNGHTQPSVNGNSEKLGQVSFLITCEGEAQKQFKRALAMLHSFWYTEARTAFEEVTQTDPECSMGYWGIAMTYNHPLWEPPSTDDLEKGSAAIKMARSVGKNTEREWLYIAALETFYKKMDRVDHETRAEDYSQAMKRVYERYHDDQEAAIFYALSLLGTTSPNDKTYKMQRRAGEILERILEDQPNHPGVAHYIIHSYDYPELAHRAEKAAQIYSNIAPSVPHVLHMPSHIFTRLGLWDESIQSNLASSQAAKRFAEKKNPGGISFEDLHALDYLMYAYLQKGEDQKARDILKEIQSVKEVQTVNLASAYALSAIPARYAIERRSWGEASDLLLHPSQFPWEQYPWTEATVVFTRAIGNARGGNLAKAKKNVKRLQELQNETKKVKKKYWVNQIEIQRLTASAWVVFAEGDHDQGLKLMQLAVSLESKTEKSPVTPGPILPASELLGEMLLALDQPDKALMAFESALESSPNRFNGLYGAAKAAEQSGKMDEAMGYYSKLVEICRNSNGDRAELKEAKTFLKKLKK
jgi:tetratricopeptide (TPR) repeat protein